MAPQLLASKSWFGFRGDRASFQALIAEMAGLEVREDEDSFFLCHQDLIPRSSPSQTWLMLQAFSDRANDLLVLAALPSLHSISPYGAIQHQHGDGTWNYELLPIGGRLDLTLAPAHLRATARSNTPSCPTRNLDVRTSELKRRAPEFVDALGFFRKANDFPQLYKAMEAIERGNGGFPPKRKNPAARADFCRKIGLSEAEWEQLHESARPTRHAYPHAPNHPPISFNIAKLLIRRSLENWLVREEPT